MINLIGLTTLRHHKVKKATSSTSIVHLLDNNAMHDNELFYITLHILRFLINTSKLETS